MNQNIIAVEKEMKQFNDLFQMLLDAHQEYNQLLRDNERGRYDNWFDDVDTHCCVDALLAKESCQRAKSSQRSARSSRSISDKGSMNSKKS